MSFANAPANIFELLSDETEQPKVLPAKSAVQPVKPPQQQSQPRSGTNQPRTENKGLALFHYINYLTKY
jgi:hypothetical protein